MKMTILNAKEIILSNKDPTVPNKDKPRAFLEISGIKIECFHSCSYHFVVCLSVVSDKMNWAVVEQSSESPWAVLGQSSSSLRAVIG